MLETGIVMISQTLWNAVMMVVIAVDHLSTQYFALNVSALINLETMKVFSIKESAALP